MLMERIGTVSGRFTAGNGRIGEYFFIVPEPCVHL